MQTDDKLMVESYVDAHIHIADLLEVGETRQSLLEQFRGQLRTACLCTSCCTEEDFRLTHEFCSELATGLSAKEPIATSSPVLICEAFGIHPQLPSLEKIDYLEKLCKDGLVGAIGEVGFDLYNQDFARTIALQTEAMNLQLELALQYELPVVIHLRKAQDYLFKSLPKLKRLRAVVFHGWALSANEARAILKRGINAYFSIGKALLRGQKTVMDSASNLPLERLLTETDAPFMTDKGGTYTRVGDIRLVAKRLAELRNEKLDEKIEYREFLASLRANFFKCFG